jgi:alpha-1,6-mannosyltransferase
VNKLILKYAPIPLLFISLIAYYYLGYCIERSQFFILISLISFLFFGYYIVLKSDSKLLFPAGILFRFVLLFSLPTLSQDFYRFIWDGRLVLEGINPLVSRPNDMLNHANAAWFINKMGAHSASNYSNYPPFAQYVFVIGAWIGKGNIAIEVFVLKLILFISDLIIYFFGKKILEFFKLKTQNIYLYFLNPLVIIESIGNAHFEVLMMAFFCMALYFSIKNKSAFSAIFMALGIATKLIPLFYLALNFRLKHLKQNLVFYLIVLSVLVFLLMPFLDISLFEKYGATIGLWFGKFEFNASFYYLIRELGYWILGYNINGLYGKFILLALLVLIFWSQNKYKEVSIRQSLLLFQSFLTFYFLTSTTVHPWYMISLVFLNIFNNQKSVLLWSFLIFLSYFSYKYHEFKENSIVLTIEYMVVWLLFLFETLSINSRFRDLNENLETE